MKTVGYLRESTTKQETEKNKAAILSMANDLDLGKVEFVEETVSGRVDWRGVSSAKPRSGYSLMDHHSFRQIDARQA